MIIGNSKGFEMEIFSFESCPKPVDTGAIGRER